LLLFFSPLRGRALARQWASIRQQGAEERPPRLLHCRPMSVFTAITESDLIALLGEAGLRLLAFRPASSGIENSNYLIDACNAAGRRQDLVLTLFEQLPAKALPWYAQVLEQVAASGLPVPCPISLPRGTLFQLAGKPAMLVPRLPGQHIDQPQAGHCRQIGAALARLHQVEISSPTPLPDERTQLVALLGQLKEGADKTLARHQLDRWLASSGPRRLVHADLFRDNALFDGERLSGLLDFYHACHDRPIYDLAVAINDWCVDSNGQPDQTLQDALLAGYGSEQLLSMEELSSLPLALTIAAMRFWLSRLAGQHQQALEGQGSKDPAPFYRLWQLRSQAL
jgi:homoserine kinase type II